MGFNWFRKILSQKDRLLNIFFISFSFVLIFLIFISIKYIKSGVLLSEPVQLKVCADFIKDDDLLFYRVTRLNAEFKIPFRSVGGCRVYENNEWFRQIKLSINSGIVPSLKNINLNIGQKQWYFKSDQLNFLLATSTQNYSQIIFDRGLVGSGLSSLSTFSDIINWPGDYNLILRCLKVSYISLSLLFIFLFIFLFILDSWNKKNIEKFILIDKEQVKKISTNYRYIFTAILSIVSLIIFLRASPTAYDWPAMDMGPFFSRQADPNFAINDFFTNSSSKPNPRFIFGYVIIALKNLLFTNWYSAMFFLKVVLVMFLPSLIYLVLTNIFIDIQDEKRKIMIYIFLFIFTLLAFSGYFINFFTIALWSLLSMTPIAQSLSVLVGFFAAYLSSFNKFRYIYPILFVFASLLHPAEGLFLIVFFLIIKYFKNKKIDYIIYFLSGILIPFCILLSLFPSSSNLSGTNFVYHYILANHSFHYLPTHFTGTSTNPLPWYINFALINLLFFTSLLVGYFKKDNFLKTTSFLCLITYAGCVLFEYLFVELYPLKSFAMLGPVRFTMFGYWLLVVIYSYILSDFYKYFIFLFIKFKNEFKKNTILLAILIWLLLLMLIYVNFKDNPFQKIRNEDKNFYSWIENNTNSKQTFVSNLHELIVNLPLVSNRSIFTGNGFPFREDDFEMYDDKRFLVFGSPEDWKKNDDGAWDGIKINNFYRSLGPADFVKVSLRYPLDYVIIEKNFSDKFYKYSPVFENDNIKIYRITDLKIKKI